MPPTTTDTYTTEPLPDDHVYTDHVHPWEEIVHYVSLNQVSNLRRNKDSQEIYQKWVGETKAEYGTIAEYLKEKKIRYPEQKQEDIDAGKIQYLILPNDFPYSVTPGIEHILIWSRLPISSDKVEGILRETYDHKKWEWVYFVNPPQWQSVPSLPHTHIFMREREEEKL